MKKILIHSISISILLITTTLSAQVTIGSQADPSSGALLDLKETANGTSSKGLGLPRVVLTDKNKLYPMLEVGYDGSEDIKHIGLVVYNTNDVFEELCSGFSVWNGEEWSSTPPCSWIKLDKTSLQLLVGETEQLTAILKPDDLSDKSVSWSSANPSVASVDDNGLVTAISYGNTQIIAVSSTGRKAISSIEVKTVSYIQLDRTVLNFTANTSNSTILNLYRINPTWAANRPLVWTSDNPNVTVTGGNIVANGTIAPGTKVTIQASLGGRSATCELFVLNCGGNGIVVNKWMGTKQYPTHGFGPQCFAVRSSDEGTYLKRWYQDNSGYGNIGAYYTWAQAVAPNNACPTGWHLPASQTEMTYAFKSVQESKAIPGTYTVHQLWAPVASDGNTTYNGLYYFDGRWTNWDYSNYYWLASPQGQLYGTWKNSTPLGMVVSSDNSGSQAHPVRCIED